MRLRRRRGHTLLEVFLAMVLLSTIIFAVVGLYPGAMGSMTRSHQITVGANLTQQWIETYRGGPFGQVTSPVPNPVAAPTTVDTVVYNPQVTVQTSTPLGDINLTQITVINDWNATSSARYDYALYNFCNPP